MDTSKVCFHAMHRSFASAVPPTGTVIAAGRNNPDHGPTQNEMNNFECC